MIETLMENPFDLETWKIYRDYVYDTPEEVNRIREVERSDRRIVLPGKFSLKVLDKIAEGNLPLVVGQNPYRVYNNTAREAGGEREEIVVSDNFIQIRGVNDHLSGLIPYTGPLFYPPTEWDTPGAPRQPELYQPKIEMNKFEGLKFFREVVVEDGGGWQNTDYPTTTREDSNRLEVMDYYKANLGHPIASHSTQDTFSNNFSFIPLLSAYYGVYVRYSEYAYFFTMDIDAKDDTRPKGMNSDAILSRLLDRLKNVGYLLYKSSTEGGYWIITDRIISSYDIWRIKYVPECPIIEGTDQLYQQIAKQSSTYVLRAFPRPPKNGPQGAFGPIFVPEEIRCTSKNKHLLEFKEAFKDHWKFMSNVEDRRNAANTANTANASRSPTPSIPATSWLASS